MNLRSKRIFAVNWTCNLPDIKCGMMFSGPVKKVTWCSIQCSVPFISAANRVLSPRIEIVHLLFSCSSHCVSKYLWVLLNHRCIHTNTKQHDTTRMKRRRKKPIQPQNHPLPFASSQTSSLWWVCLVKIALNAFFLRARPIPLPLVLSYYVRGLNLMPCAPRLCQNTALTLRRLMSYIYIYIWSTHSWCF